MLDGNGEAFPDGAADLGDAAGAEDGSDRLPNLLVGERQALGKGKEMN